jgi:hypothetical protein
MPGFFSKAENITDPDIINASGAVTYFPKTSEYKVADSAKLRNLQTAGNVLSLNTVRCILSGEGQLNLAANLGRLQMKSAGVINYYSIVDSTSLNAMSALDFFFSDEALTAFADALNGTDARGIDVSANNYTRALREFVGPEEAEKILTELNSYGQYRKFPDVLDHTLVLTNLNMSYNKDLRSFVSKGQFGVGNIGKIPVNKLVNGYFEISKRRSGDIINIYIEPSENLWYFFTYSNRTMQVISSDKAFNDKLVGLKESQRLIKGEKGQPSYQYIVGTNEKKATFLRKMKQAAGED